MNWDLVPRQICPSIRAVPNGPLALSLIQSGQFGLRLSPFLAQRLVQDLLRLAREATREIQAIEDRNTDPSNQGAARLGSSHVHWTMDLAIGFDYDLAADEVQIRSYGKTALRFAGWELKALAGGLTAFLSELTEEPL